MSADSLKYFCDVSSMYGFLDHERIVLLEKAIWLGKLGLYDESLSIFENDLMEWMIVPVVVYEKVMVQWSQARLRDAYTTLSSFLEDRSEDDLNLPEYRLLALVLAFVEIYHRGKIDRAVYEIDRTREWLQNVSVASYTDVQVAVIGWFVRAETSLFISSNKSRQENSSLPNSNRSHRPWAGLADLRTYLLGSERLGEACSLLLKSCILRIYSEEAIVRLYRETLSRLPATAEDPNAWQKLFIIKLQLRASLLDTLGEYGTLDHIQSEISLMEEDLAALKSTFDLGANSVKRTRFYLRLCLARIQLIPKTNHEDIYSQSMLLLQNHYTESREITDCYQGAALAAKSLYQQTGDKFWRNKLETLFEKKEQLQFHVFGDILNSLVAHRESIPNSDFDFTTMSMEEVQRILEWYESYQRDYPGFAVPLIAHGVATLKLRLYLALGDKSGTIREKSKLKEWKDKLPLPTGSELLTTEQGLNDEREGFQFDRGNDTIQYLEGNPQMTYRLLADIVSEMVKKVESDPAWMKGFPGQASLVQWLKDDFRSGYLSLEELEGIFACDETETQHEVDNVLSPPIRDLPFLEQLLAAFSSEFDSEPRLEFGNPGPTSDTDLPPLLKGIKADNIAKTLCGPFQRPISINLWLRRSVALSSWLRRRSNILQTRKDIILTLIYELRARQSMGHFAIMAQSFDKNNESDSDDSVIGWDAFRDSIERFRDCIKVLDESRADLFQAFPMAMDLKIGYQTQILTLFCMYILFVWNTDPEVDNDNMLRTDEIVALNGEVVELSRELIRLRKEKEQYGMLAQTQAQLAILLLLKTQQNTRGSLEDMFVWRDEGLQLLRQADDTFSSKLHRHRGATIIESIFNKEDSQTLRAAHIIPQVALKLLLLPNGFKQEEQALIWEWVQRSKAKALHSVMIGRQEQNSGRDETKDDLFGDITANTDDNDKLISFADLDRMANNSGFENVAFVDWFSIPKHPQSAFGQIFMIIVRPGGETIIEELEMMDRDVVLWQGTRFTAEYENLSTGKRVLEVAMEVPRAQSPLQELRPLVKPLEKLTNPGDLLVFCPSKYLYQLPLHALELPQSRGTALIHRNPIVYSYSLSVLRHNFLTASAAMEGESSTGPKEAILFGEIAKGELFRRGKEAIQQLGNWFGVTPFCDARATKSALLGAAPKASLLHFHTHVNSLTANPLSHCISLSPETGSIPEPMPDAIRRHPWSSLIYPKSQSTDFPSSPSDITVGEISNLINLPSPCHVTMITCGGGRLRVHLGDEIMGLIPAFMIKGATSVIATLWSIPDLLGAKFTENFYKSLYIEAGKEKNNGGGSGLVNMAKAFQAAIIALDDNDLAPYDWAPFVLQGWWMYEPPPMTEEGHPWSNERPFFE